MPTGTSGKIPADFADAGQVASWAKDAIALFVRTGVVQGSAGKLNPEALTTRAEMAQILYNLLVRQTRI